MRTRGGKSKKTEINITVNTIFSRKKKKQSDEMTSYENAKKFIMSIFQSPHNLAAIVSASKADESKPAAKFLFPQF